MFASHHPLYSLPFFQKLRTGQFRRLRRVKELERGLHLAMKVRDWSHCSAAGRFCSMVPHVQVCRHLLDQVLFPCQRV